MEAAAANPVSSSVNCPASGWGIGSPAVRERLVLAGHGDDGGDGIALAPPLHATGRQVGLALAGATTVFRPKRQPISAPGGPQAAGPPMPD